MGILSGVHFSPENAGRLIVLLYETHGMEAVDVYAQWLGLPYAYCSECEQDTPWESAGHDPANLQGPCICYLCENRENF